MPEDSEPQVAPEQSTADRPVAPRRLLIGANVVISIILVIGLVVAANFVAWWLTGRYGLSADMTDVRAFTLSSRTRLLLDKISDPVRMTFLYVADPRDEDAAVRKRRVEDLLRLYQASGRRIDVQLIDPTEQPSELNALGRRVAAIYAPETRPYVDAVKSFLTLKNELAKTLVAERERYAAMSRVPGISPAMKSLTQELTRAMEQAGARFDELEDDIRAWTLGEIAGDAAPEVPAAEDRSRSLGIPDYSRATSSIGALADSAAQLFELAVREVNRQLQVDGVKVPEAVRHELQGVEERYKDLNQRLRDVSTHLKDLKPLELDDVRNNLSLNAVIIEFPTQARVVGFNDLWPAAPGESRLEPDAERRFNGEDAVTGALLRLAGKEKVAAVFVQWAGMPISEFYGPYTELASRLGRNNFLIQTWDLSRESSPPKADGVTRTVYVLLPPAPPSREMPMMPPNPDAYAPVHDLLAAGGRALVFARPRVSPMIPEIPYLHLLADFGVVVRTDYMSVVSIDAPEGKTILAPGFETARYPSETSAAPRHPIVEPLEGMRAVFPLVAVLEPAAPLPPGVTVQPLVEAPDRENYWAENDIMTVLQTQAGRFDPATDMRAPFAVALTVTADAATPSKQPPAEGEPAATAPQTRLVVFGGDLFATDEYAGRQLAMSQTGRVGLDYPSPANGEILVNAMLWLSDQEDMIAVSPRAQQDRRIGNVPKFAATLIGIGLPIGLPVLVVLVGIAVYIVRVRKR